MGKQTKKQKQAIKKALVMFAFAENIPVLSKHRSKKSKWVLAIEPSWQWHTTKYKIDPDYHGHVPTMPVHPDKVVEEHDDDAEDICPFDVDDPIVPEETRTIPYIGTQCIYQAQLCVLLDIRNIDDSEDYECDIKFLATERIENDISADSILFTNPDAFVKWEYT